MPIRAERVFVEVFKLTSGKTLEQVRRSELFRSLLERFQVDSVELPSVESTPRVLRFQNRRYLAQFIATGDEVGDFTPRFPLPNSLAEEYALVLCLTEQLLKSAMKGLPRKLRTLAAEWEEADTEERISILRQLSSTLRLQDRSLSGPSLSAELSAADADEAFQPLIRSLPRLALKSGVVPNCIGKAQLIMAWSVFADADCLGFIPAVGPHERSSEEVREFLRWMCHRVNHRFPLPYRLERALQAEALAGRDDRRASDRMHLAPVIQVRPFTWYFVDPHQGLFGDPSGWVNLEHLGAILEDLEFGDVVAVDGYPEFEKLLKGDIGVFYERFREGLTLYRRLQSAVHHPERFYTELTNSDIPYLILGSLDLDIIRAGELEHQLQPVKLWPERRDDLVRARHRVRYSGAVGLTDELLRRDPSRNAGRSSNERRELSAEEELTENLKQASELYLEHLAAYLYNLAIKTREEAVAKGRYLHCSGDFIEGLFSATVAVLSHAGIELNCSDETEELLADLSADRYRVMYVAGRPLRERRAPSPDELLAMELLEELPAKSHHVRDLLSRLRSHRKRWSTDGTEEEESEDQLRQERLEGKGEARP